MRRSTLARRLELFEQVGECFGQNLANVLRAKICLDAGRYLVALDIVTATLEQTEETADHRNMAHALADRVEILRNLGHTDHAVRDCTRAVNLSRSTDYRWGEVRTLIGLAEAYLHDGLTSHALACAVDAHRLAGRYGFRMLEGLALTVAGEIHLAAGEPAAAAKLGTDALDLHHQIGYQLGAARAHTILGQSVNDATASSHREAASMILVELGLAAPQDAG